MSWFSRRRVEGGPGPILRVDRLNVHYGRAHAVQDVSVTLDRGILAVVGRNGMGKTTLCNAITGLVAASGSIRLSGTELVGLPPHAITGLGVGYVPQGRRVWPSLTVDEHLRLAERSAHRGVCIASGANLSGFQAPCEREMVHRPACPGVILCRYSTGAGHFLRGMIRSGIDRSGPEPYLQLCDAVT